MTPAPDAGDRLAAPGMGPTSLGKRGRPGAARSAADPPPLPPPPFRRRRQRQETHAVAQRKQDQMDRLRGAFGLRETKEGEAFDRELQERRRQEKIADRDAREKERRCGLAGGGR